MGAHTLSGVFVEGENTRFSNKYFKIMLDREVDWSRVVSTGRWDGFSAAKSNDTHLISDDCQSEYDSAKANGDLDTFHHCGATEGGETPLHTRCALRCEGEDDRSGEKVSEPNPFFIIKP